MHTLELLLRKSPERRGRGCPCGFCRHRRKRERRDDVAVEGGPLVRAGQTGDGGDEVGGPIGVDRVREGIPSDRIGNRRSRLEVPAEPPWSQTESRRVADCQGTLAKRFR